MSLFSQKETHNQKLLEIGCARSAWLPYFAKEFNFKVSGLDYSPLGCEMAEELLRRNDIKSTIVCADLFSPPEDMMGQFDVVCSFGVVEHFDSTSACLAALSKFLKPGGIIVTSIPNMTGAIGLLQKITNKPVYDIHVPIDREMLLSAHEKAEFKIIENDYFMSVGFGVCNLTGVKTGTFSYFFKKVMLGILSRMSMVIWRIEDSVGPLLSTKLLSPFIFCVARKLDK
jgi:2-polyprenyl-3-methyl-5-hydroxy-6-metoxy-1,4-benzoquinol methylase